MSLRRVLLTISSMRGGGSERQTLQLLKALDRDRFEPHLYLLERTGDLLEQLPADVTVHSFDDAPRQPPFYLPGWIRRRQIGHLREVIRGSAIDVVYDRTFQMTLLAAPAAGSLGAPRVSTIVSPPDEMVPQLERRFVAAKRRRLRRGYSDASRVIAVSRIAADSAERFYRLPAGRVDVVPNAVDIEGLRAAAAEVRPERDGRLTLVCVGRMTAEKGQRDLLRALEICEHRWPESADPMRVWLIGDGPLRPQLESLWSSIGGRHRVEFLGRLRNPAPHIAAADALILPSRTEGMPNVVLEAMALGTPVIATRAGGTVELERERPTALWAEPGDPRSLASAIREFAADRAAAGIRAAAAEAMVRRHHDIGQTARVVESYLAEAANRQVS